MFPFLLQATILPPPAHDSLSKDFSVLPCISLPWVVDRKKRLFIIIIILCFTVDSQGCVTWGSCLLCLYAWKCLALILLFHSHKKLNALSLSASACTRVRKHPQRVRHDGEHRTLIVMSYAAFHILLLFSFGFFFYSRWIYCSL